MRSIKRVTDAGRATARSAIHEHGDSDVTRPAHADILVVGGGTAGIAVSAGLRRAMPSAVIALVEPAATHYYQPGFTLVGAGLWSADAVRQEEAACVPSGVTWIRDRAIAFDPDANRVELAVQGSLGYDYVVACPGLELQWDRVPGLADALGKGRVSSVYDLHSAVDTAAQIKAFRGGRALFTQPPMPIKCPGAPQKIAYLASDHWRRRGMLHRVRPAFYTATPTLFSVSDYVPTLEGVAERYGIERRYNTRLVAVDDDAAEAMFERDTDDGATERWTEGYDLLHAVPPQGPPAAVRSGPLADAAGWVEVDPSTLQHRRYANVFALGDASSAPTSKTAAAVRAQVPVIVANLAAVARGAEPPLAYSGYASCPLTTAIGRVVLAEFVYGREIRPTLPWDSTRERRSAWWLKTQLLPWMYWQRLLKGRDLPLVARH